MNTVLRKSLKDNAYVRWSVIVILGFVLAGNYYFYDAFSPLQKILRDDYGFSPTDFGMFISFYSIPNTFLLMTVFGGIILDRFGIRRTGFLFILMMSLGALLTAYATTSYFRSGGIGYDVLSGFLPSYSAELKMMLLGRFFYGLGAETSIVVISKTIVKWFKGKELALAFGIKLGFARLGSTMAFILSPRLLTADAGIHVAVWFAAIFVTAGLLAFIFYIFYDLKLDRQIKTETESNREEQFRISDIFTLFTNRSFIYITLLCLTFYSAVFPFLSFSPDFFLNKFGMSLEQSGVISALLPIGTVIFTPIFGFVVDRYGRSATLMIYGSLVLVLVHLTFTFTSMTPYVPMILLGIAFSLVPASMWPSVARIIDERRIGTAYGVMFSIQNLGLWGIPILAGVILDATNEKGAAVLDYTNTMFMFAVLGVIGLIFALLLRREDKTSGFGLELPSNKKSTSNENQDE